MEYLIKQYPLETGALEIQYIEEYFGEFPRKKTATEIATRLRDRELIVARIEAQWSYDEIAHRFTMRTSDAARMAVTRALKRLMEYIRKIEHPRRSRA